MVFYILNYFEINFETLLKKKRTPELGTHQKVKITYLWKMEPSPIICGNVLFGFYIT